MPSMDRRQGPEQWLFPYFILLLKNLHAKLNKTRNTTQLMKLVKTNVRLLAAGAGERSVLLVHYVIIALICTNTLQ